MTTPTRELRFMQPYIESYMSQILTLDMNQAGTNDARCERFIRSLMSPVLGDDVTLDQFATWVHTSCDGFDSKNSLELAVLLFDAFFNQLGEHILKKTWNVLGECIYYCGSLPSKLAVYFFFVKLSQMKFDWKDLISEENRHDATGPTLVMDFSLFAPLLEHISNKGRRPYNIADYLRVQQDENIRLDFHAWCVDDANEVYDYPSEQIESNSVYWTENMIRRPWDAEHIILAYPQLLEARMNTSQYIEEIEPLTLEEKMTKIADGTFPLNCCLDRALTLRESNPRLALQIGSLGFKQPDGSIFWEFG